MAYFQIALPNLPATKFCRHWQLSTLSCWEILPWEKDVCVPRACRRANLLPVKKKAT